MRCALADPDCAGRLEWHHVLGQNRLKREFPYGAYRVRFSDEPYRPMTRGADPAWLQVQTLNCILGDKRNRVWLCSHHHELQTNARVDVQLPESVWEFAREFGLTAMLENDVARKNAA